MTEMMNMRPGAAGGQCPRCLDTTQTVVAWYQSIGRGPVSAAERKRMIHCGGCGHSWQETADPDGNWASTATPIDDDGDRP